MTSTVRTRINVAVLATCAIVLAGSIIAAQQEPLRREGSALLSVAAKVTAIDLATRVVTLKGPAGNEVTFTVDKRVTRLNEIKVGDEVIADYYESFAAELRPPTAEEKANPLVVLDKTAKAPAGTEPAGGALRITRAVVTVEGLDRPTMSLTVANSKGHLLTVQVDNVANLSKMRLGDTIVVTYVEALAVSLEKRAPKK
jgi:hypothetical protein